MIRRVDPARIRDLVSHTPGGGRTDITLVDTERTYNESVPDLRPGYVCFGLTADTLFPFSQVTLVQTAKMLEAWGVEVEVIGIRATAAPARRAGIRHLAA